MQVTKSGSVRVDLVGGTLDLDPIHLILPNVFTLNVATSLKAKVSVEMKATETIEIISKDYNKNYSFERSLISEENLYTNNHFNEMTFVLQIIDLFNFDGGLKVELSSGAPAGSGLGGSSAMGIVLYKTMEELLGLDKIGTLETVQKVKGVEGRILNQGIPGYQDYFPALTGGILALSGSPGVLNFEQLYTKELKDYLEKHITLVYSGISRNSGINNWSVYKSFFDGDETVRKSLSEIAQLSHKTYLAIKENKFEKILSLISSEGEERVNLSKNITPKEIASFMNDIKSLSIGYKMCGAGGGGCFIIMHDASSKQEIIKKISKTNFKVLDFKIEEPLQ